VVWKNVSLEGCIWIERITSLEMAKIIRILKELPKAITLALSGSKIHP